MVFEQRSLLSLFASIIVVLNLCGVVSALDANFSVNANPSQFFNLGVNDTFNVTVGALSENISRVEIIFTGVSESPGQGEVFILGSNITSATETVFSNYTTGSGTLTLNFSFLNISSGGIVANGSTRTFSVDLKMRRTTSFVQMAVRATGSNSATTNQTATLTFSPAFAFSGFIRNETGCSTCWQNGTNVTIYGVMDTPGGGPQTSQALGSSLTNESGYFRISRVNASSAFRGFKLKTVFYNATGSATKIGSILPDFPAMMYYGGGDGGFDMSLNGGTFYLQPATTIQLLATNGSAQVSFGYEVIDQALGFPIESNIQSKVSSVTLVVPSARAYTVSFMRMPQFPGSSVGYANDPACFSSDLMNDTSCPTPPKSSSVSASSAAQGTTVTINQSLIVRKVNVHGCISPSVNANNTAINITIIQVKMVPWALPEGSFVPPARGDDNSINLSSSAQFNITYPGCLAYYNITLLNTTAYMIEMYAKNATHALDAGNPGQANNLAGFQNLTATDNLQMNITLYRLAGSYRSTATNGVSVNTSLIKVNIINSTGGAVTTNVNANIKIKNRAAGIGTIFYIVDPSTIVNGSFYIPVLNNSNFAKVMVFSSNGPPRETKINISESEVNITVVSMQEDKGFRRFHANGSLGQVDTSVTPIQMRFLRTDAECDVVNAPTTCEITSTNASSFNPLKAMLAGKVNMEIKITSTNVTLIFHDYDMFSAKQPPMSSIIPENATGRTSSGGRVQDTWNFGSFAPADSYENVTIVLPYSDSASSAMYLNDTLPVNISIPILYDDNSVVIWNVSNGDGAQNLSDDFIEYNNTFYLPLINSTTGIRCNTTDPNALATLNTSANYIALRIPHFSTLGATVSGGGTVTPDTEEEEDDDDGGSGGGGTNSTTYWQRTVTQSDKELSEKGVVNAKLYAKERVRVRVNGTLHYVGVISLTSSTAKINVSSTPQQAIFNIGDSKKFEVTNDTYYDIEVTLNRIVNSSANVSIKAIHESRNTTVIPPPATRLPPVVNQTNTTAPPPLPGEEDQAHSTTKTVFIILAIILVLGIIGASIYLYWREHGKSEWLRNKVKVRSP